MIQKKNNSNPTEKCFYFLPQSQFVLCKGHSAVCKHSRAAQKIICSLQRPPRTIALIFISGKTTKKNKIALLVFTKPSKHDCAVLCRFTYILPKMLLWLFSVNNVVWFTVEQLKKSSCCDFLCQASFYIKTFLFI